MPFGLGDAFETCGTLCAVPPLFWDLGEYAPLHPDPRITVCPSPDGPTLADHRIREQGPLETPLNPIKNLVDRLHP
ncbi:hypothetical protein SCATT_29110 [Streptantibioticus cattleyicolor NRRL 8057 = DSM 46488]|uniref:Uncharacterized protein n=1 Tax=Streptantibioticus cattleyicolor (strain ATCC 35852 / DSM 46488 / JCM 4925 / NBRC 14057 / NRRL 8057) TaxID=1003195 RepID=G8WQR8_STREN|nr:hypothetical protein SCATT_29110 [Streptantibioticus cattleyicolor NRRL 8057 = DSM 46488]